MITPTEPRVRPDGYYTVTAAAEALGVHRNTLRDYTMRGLLKVEFRPETARKLYSGSELIRFWRARL